ncbi:uncharacterized protein LOC131664187 isoform X2 [Phymastichus coffea]|nr:uncharacterized protein LOC131664187 isoform X2 [Phymastichus coffea]XP_058791068.1 uncharacterized protein LOC131664187 isoform X2 [Phymastichus coffea]
MVENDKEYVLQWPGHAAYVSERFSGLLARQTLVDITLICEEQKLRVHKLVLASCSLYFEEMLAEDLGPEPIVFLRDLDFSILKAMIEFMYCGETTVSHIHLPSLLTAARLFKVKELESLVEKMLGLQAQDHNDNEEYPSKDVSGTGFVNGLMSNEDTGIRVSFSNKHVNKDQDTTDASDCSESECERNYLDDNTLDNPNGGCLYNESCSIIKSKNCSTIHRNGEVAKERQNSVYWPESAESASDSSSTLDSGNCKKVRDAALYERLCDFVGNGCAKSNDRPSFEVMENEVNRVGQCSKVYTHKKRKVNGDSTTERFPHLEKNLPQPLASNRIDLADESSNDETPVTLQTNLDGEGCLLSFNSIQSIVGCSLTDFCPSSSFDELLNTRTTDVDEKDSAADDAEGEEEEDKPPVLRRSVRLKQEPEEETFSRRSRLRSKLRDDKKNQKTKMKLFPRKKSKPKELERRVPNVKVIMTTGSTRKSHSKTLRKQSSKIAGKCNSTKNANHLPKSEKEVGSSTAKPRTMDKPTTESTEKAELAAENNNHHASESVKPNTTASVNRALWGDMSDVAEDGEISQEFLEYSASAEIPFAVGLLPLRAALERMQATLDHQPRKTRSSVASTKQEPNGLKRKATIQEVASSSAKKQTISESEADENASAVCHIQIRTSSQCSKPRKRSLSDGATAGLEQTAVSGRQ